MLKNVIFDIGDVLLSYRWRTVLTEAGYGPEDAREISRSITRNPLWNQLDLGLLTHQEITEKLSELMPDRREAITWFFQNTDRLHIGRPEIWDRVRRLKEAGYGIYLLSNYGREMYEIHAAHQPFQDYVDGAVVSFMIHAAKPDPEIYETLLGRYGLNREECLFLDDREVNVKGAEAVGIRALQVKSEEWLAAFLDQLLESGESAVSAAREEAAAPEGT